MSEVSTFVHDLALRGSQWPKLSWKIDQRASFVFHGSGANQSVGSGPAAPGMALVWTRLDLSDGDGGAR